MCSRMYELALNFSFTSDFTSGFVSECCPKAACNNPPKRIKKKKALRILVFKSVLFYKDLFFNVFNITHIVSGLAVSADNERQNGMRRTERKLFFKRMDGKGAVATKKI